MSRPRRQSRRARAPQRAPVGLSTPTLLARGSLRGRGRVVRVMSLEPPERSFAGLPGVDMAQRDQTGATRFITPETVVSALHGVKHGKLVDLSHTIHAGV